MREGCGKSERRILAIEKGKFSAMVLTQTQQKLKHEVTAKRHAWTHGWLHVKILHALIKYFCQFLQFFKNYFWFSVKCRQGGGHYFSTKI